MPGMSRPEIMARTCVDELVRAYADPDVAVAVAVAAVDAREGTATAHSVGCPADARFEIGSVTKTLTGTLLASLADDGTVSLDDPVERWIPAGAGTGITLRQLATHTSGLPRLGRNQRRWAMLSPSNPYMRYTAKRAERDLRGFARSGQGGAHAHAYSNFGYQLLALALVRASGRTYQQLLEDRVLNQLAMKHTGVGAAGGGTRIQGHAKGRWVPHWDHPLPGAGGVESTIDDVARYAEACLAAASGVDPAPTTIPGALVQAIKLAQTPLVDIDERRKVGLAWICLANRLLWHNGRTGGFTASLAVDGKSGRALAILVSTASGPPEILDRLVLRTLRGTEASD